MDQPLLAPAAVLVLWSLIVLLWAAITRFGAFKTSGIDLKTAAPGGRGVNLEGVLPDKVNWKSHNFTHLMEQPTLFYAVVIILALTGQDSETNVLLAWGYVVLRIVHSLWQATVNLIPVRFAIFAVATLCLVGLSINAVRATMGV